MKTYTYHFFDAWGRWTSFETPLFPLTHPWLGRKDGAYFVVGENVRRATGPQISGLDPSCWCNPSELGITFPVNELVRTMKPNQEEGNE